MRRLVTSLLAVLAGAAAYAAFEPYANAQELQLTGPLATEKGRKSVIGLRLYREGRFEIAPSFGFTLLDEYSRAFLFGGRLQYNLTDWLGFGVYGAAGVYSSTDLTDQTDKLAPRGQGQNAGNVGGSKPGDNGFTDQTGRITFMIVPQVQAVPFRGKLALFERLFVDTDAYIHLGAAIVGVEERGNCGPQETDPKKKSCVQTPLPPPGGGTFARQGRVAVAPSFGLGFTFYFNQLISFGIEYRAFPFNWNRGGYDSKGGAPGGSFPDQKVDGSDQTFKFNQMISFNVGVLLGGMKTSD
jgi:outer membrane beta-barrel protein